MFQFSFLYSSRRSVPTFFKSYSASHKSSFKFNHPLKSSSKPFSTGSHFTSTSKELPEKELRVKAIFLAFIPILTFGLGTWQVARLRWKVKLIEDYDDRLSKPPINLPKRIKLDVLKDYLYRRVKTSGKFLHDQELYLGPRTFKNKLGYYVITPLERENGTTILVKRGWIPREKIDPSTRPVGQIQGKVSVEGLLKGSEKKTWFVPENNPEKNQWYWLDVDTMAQITGSQPILVEQNLEGSPFIINQMIQDGIPVGKIPSVELSNTHLQYAITWYTLSAATSIMLYILLKKPPAGQVKRQVIKR
ncbi:uncharacterized protein OCT59_022897 [Rhizophagus irregularis]|uniref:SURF1-like protein n=2 Tax=Rhizophagus irregularis TaxID=588596 RepID=A0A2I1EPA2_9GLOM|nr:SURF1-domain-containing protein [Rhizophagus irregularis]UZO29420.1 hypothetical protein OCT59_022897 [Rhizophagus irregularis]GBC35393.1 SURF1-domain-containing protein [Rhizophagus irregularis DAOM 181602=DAOM 197198]CAB4490115.1 unnamed protein product [Rhizophagus irregularis]CAB5369845.1 unnamed protein product [Rhizophagus irregularis]